MALYVISDYPKSVHQMYTFFFWKFQQVLSMKATGIVTFSNAITGQISLNFISIRSDDRRRFKKSRRQIAGGFFSLYRKTACGALLN